MDQSTKQIIKYLILPLFLLMVAVSVGSRQNREDYQLHTDVYNFGSSRAAYIRTYAGRQILIDGGPTNDILRKLGDDLPFYDHGLDAVILTVPDNAHVGGLVDVLRRYEVKQVFVAPAPKYNAAYDEFVTLVGNRHIPVTYLQAGQRLWLDSSTLIDIESTGNILMPHLKFGTVNVDFTQDGQLTSDGRQVYRN